MPGVFAAGSSTRPAPRGSRLTIAQRVAGAITIAVGMARRGVGTFPLKNSRTDGIMPSTPVRVEFLSLAGYASEQYEFGGAKGFWGTTDGRFANNPRVTRGPAGEP